MRMGLVSRLENEVGVTAQRSTVFWIATAPPTHLASFRKRDKLRQTTGAKAWQRISARFAFACLPDLRRLAGASRYDGSAHIWYKFVGFGFHQLCGLRCRGRLNLDGDTLRND